MRRLYLDDSVGERRGVVTVDGLPERLLIERAGKGAATGRLASRSVARIARLEKGLGLAFLDLAEGESAACALTPSLVEGAFVEIEITAEARTGKAAAARVTGMAEGPVRLIEAAAGLEAELAAFAPGADIETGPAAREVCDIAQAAALAVEHGLPGGGSIAIESTRALTAVDVDLGARTGDARRAARQANLAAIAAAARLLRLKGIGGLLVIDLAGKGHDGAAMTAAAKAAFAPDGPQVSIGPISRFGLFELALPHRRRPALELLTADAAETEALDLLRALEREGRANPGSRLRAVARPEVVAAAERHAEALVLRLGARFSLVPREGGVGYEVSCL